MATLLLTRALDNHMLAQIGEGMAVLNSMHEKIGWVEAVYLGHGSETDIACRDAKLESDPLLFNLLSGVFTPHRIPYDLAERLRCTGFIRVHVMGFYGADRFITPDQIDHVSRDGVQLKVPEPVRVHVDESEVHVLG